MRLSKITILVSLFATLLNSTHLTADPVQSSFQVNPLQSQIPSRFIQPSIIQTTNTDPKIMEIVSFISTQKQLAIANQAFGNEQPLGNSASGNHLTKTVQNTQSILSKLSVRLSESGTPRQIRSTNSILMKRLSANQSTAESHAQTARHFLDTAHKLLHLDHPAQELTLQYNHTDTMGKQHLRFHQTYQDIPVWNCELTVHLDKTGNVELVDGAFSPSPNKVSTKPIYTANQAIEKARLWIPYGADAVETDLPQLVIYPEQGEQPRLAWEVKLSAALNHHWLVLVDANNGTQILAYNQVNDSATTGSGQDLFGSQQQLNIFEQVNQFFMADTSKPMFKGGNPLPSSEDKGAIYIFDDKNQSPIDDNNRVELPDLFELVSSESPTSDWSQAAVSAAFNLSATYDYYSQVHGRDSIDGNGGSIFALVRVGDEYENAFWNGTLIAFGEAQPFAGALDIVAHELTHGIIDHTANLIYRNQSGALNEAFSDIFGEAIEAHTFGQADWEVGAQLGTPLRSLRDPGSQFSFTTFRPYPATMSEFEKLPATFKRDNGGVHINSSIINHAFYLLAEGLDDAIGIDAAEQIFYRALTVYLVPRSQFIDARLALIQSATEIFGEGSIQAQKTAEAFDAVEIFDAPPTPVDSEVTSINRPDATMFIRRNSNGESSFYRRDPVLEDIETGILLNSLNVDLKRPSVAHNTAGIVAFINSNNELCFLSATSGRDNCNDLETSSNPEFHSVAISPGAEKVALVALDASGNPENKISIIDTSSRQTQTVTLATENASTTISYADTMNFTKDGQTLIYDALNEITTADGSRMNAWSIYALDLVNQTTTAVVPPVSGFNFQFPSLSQITDDYLAFDAFNQNTGINNVTITSLITGEQQIIDTSNNHGIPSFTGDDSAIVFSRPDTATATGFSLFRQPLQSDHITSSGDSELWIKDADYGVIYRQGNAFGPRQQAIVNEGLWWIPTKPGSGFDIGITSNNDLYMVWYTYTPEGTPIWYLASGPLTRDLVNGNSWNADIFEYTWNGTTAIPNHAGNATLNFQDNSHATFSWTLNTGNGSTDIEYFVFEQGGTNSSSTWFDQAQPGYGFTQVRQGSTNVNVLYFYDEAGNPRWALGSDTSSETQTAMDVFSGSCPICPFEDSVASSAGILTVSFIDQLNGHLTTDILLPVPLSGSWQIFSAPISNLSE